MSKLQDDLRQQGLPKDCTTVVNLAGATIGDPKYKQEVRSSRIETTKTLANLVRTSEGDKKVFICASAIGYYPPSDKRVYSEDSIVDSSSAKAEFFAKLCYDWEEAGDLGKDCKHRHVIVRTGIVLGKGGGIIKNLYWPFWFGLGGPFGSGSQPFPWVHLHDVVGVYMYAMFNKH
ncbi:unnamed protein product, partial [Soboliphyme baturini]|uniref:Epimerase domain-containing protein n=1 Tax=Soboliphyme baturini TaxID=241478 RepID=A0A183J5R7_9BILA